MFWVFWITHLHAENYWKASITRITGTHFDFALVNDKKLTRSYRRNDQKLIIDKVPSIGNLLPDSPVIANQFGHPGWYRSGKVIGTSGGSLVHVKETKFSVFFFFRGHSPRSCHKGNKHTSPKVLTLM